MGRKELCLSVALLLLLVISEHVRAQCTWPSFESKNVIPSGSQSSTQSFPDGSTLTFECLIGYKPINSRASKSVTCIKTQWTDLQLECTRKSCGSPPDFDNGHYVQEGILFGDKITAVCNKGYMLAGQVKDRWCRNDGWDGREPECEVVKCEAPPPIINGRLEDEPFSSYDYLQAVSYRCNSGFSLIGTSTLHCSEDGTFKPDPPTCFNGCPAPVVPNTLQRIEGKSPPYELSNFIGYKCVDSYTMKGESRILCTEKGWSPELPRCIAPCSRPDFGGNVVLTEFHSQQSFPHGMTVTFDCIPGYEPVDSSVSRSITCEETKWPELRFACKVKKCKTPPPIENGLLNDQPLDHYNYLETVSYKCNPGFSLIGISTLSCSEDGTFKPDPPKCLAQRTTTTATTIKPVPKDQGDDVAPPFSTTYIVLIVIAVLVLVIIVVVIVYKKHRSKREYSHKVATRNEEGEL